MDCRGNRQITRRMNKLEVASANVNLAPCIHCTMQRKEMSKLSDRNIGGYGGWTLR